MLPFGINRDWNLIVRTILPVISQPDLNSQQSWQNGLGDVTQTYFLSPSKPGKLIWGIGPAFVIPTSTDSALGTGKWSAGPSVVALVQPQGWTIGALANNVLSFAGDRDRPDVNSFFMQYFIYRNFDKGWFLASAPIITGNWELPAREAWLVPFGPDLGRVFKIGGQPVSGQVSAYYNLIHPETLPYPKWQLRLQFTLLFPTEK